MAVADFPWAFTVKEEIPSLTPRTIQPRDVSSIPMIDSLYDQDAFTSIFGIVEKDK